MPDSVIAFVDADIDSTSDGWTKVQQVAQRFPGWAKVMAQINTGLAKTENGISFKQDVQPWLGDEAAVGVTSLQLTPQPKPEVAAYVKVKDEAKALAFIQKTKKLTATGEVDGYKEFKSTGSSSDVAYVALGNGALLAGSTKAALDATIQTREGKAPSLA